MNSQDLINFMQRAMKPLKDRVLLMISRAVVSGVDDSKDIQELQLKVLFGETLARVQRLQGFGFNSVPPSGIDAVVLFIGGNRENGVVVATDSKELRPTDWAVGESGFYNSEGSIAVLRTGGKYEVDNGTEELVTVLSDLTQAIIDSKNITAIGPQPMTPDSIAAITAIKARLDTFKV